MPWPYWGSAERFLLHGAFGRSNQTQAGAHELLTGLYQRSSCAPSFNYEEILLLNKPFTGLLLVCQESSIIISYPHIYEGHVYFLIF